MWSLNKICLANVPIYACIKNVRLRAHFLYKCILGHWLNRFCSNFTYHISSQNEGDISNYKINYDTSLWHSGEIALFSSSLMFPMGWKGRGGDGSEVHSQWLCSLHRQVENGHILNWLVSETFLTSSALCNDTPILWQCVSLGSVYHLL